MVKSESVSCPRRCNTGRILFLFWLEYASYNFNPFLWSVNHTQTHPSENEKNSNEHHFSKDTELGMTGRVEILSVSNGDFRVFSCGSASASGYTQTHLMMRCAHKVPNDS